MVIIVIIHSTYIWFISSFLPLILDFESPIAIIDGYTVDAVKNSPVFLPLGITVILVCRVSGIPHGLQTNYHWTCPNGPCQQTGYAGRKINNNMLAINITSASDGGTYTCKATAKEREASQHFLFSVSGQFANAHTTTAYYTCHTHSKSRADSIFYFILL